MARRFLQKAASWIYDVRKITLIFTVLVAVTFFVGYRRQTTVIEQQKSQLTQIEDIGKGNRSTGNLIKDCVDPGGKCFRDGQERTGQLVVSINDATIAAVSCAQTEDSYAAIKVCVERILKNR
jgi:hypothetical protein